MKMRKLIALLTTILMLCAMLPVGALTAVADDNPLQNGGFETGEGHIEIRTLQIGDEQSQLFKIPLARNLVEGDVESLFLLFGKFNHNTVHFGDAHVLQDFFCVLGQILDLVPGCELGLEAAVLSDAAAAEMCGQVIYPAAVLKESNHPEEAKAFLEFLQTDACMEIFEGVGFSRVN